MTYLLGLSMYFRGPDYRDSLDHVELFGHGEVKSLSQVGPSKNDDVMRDLLTIDLNSGFGESIVLHEGVYKCTADLRRILTHWP